MFGLMSKVLLGVVAVLCIALGWSVLAAKALRIDSAKQAGSIVTLTQSVGAQRQAFANYRASVAIKVKARESRALERKVLIKSLEEKLSVVAIHPVGASKPGVVVDCIDRAMPAAITGLFISGGNSRQSRAGTPSG